MALDFGLKHSTIFFFNKHKMTAKKLVEKANGINKNAERKVIVLSAADEDEGCESFLSVFAKTPEMVQTLFHIMNNWFFFLLLFSNDIAVIDNISKI